MRDAIQAITNLVYRYAELVDQGDFDAAGSLFARGTFRALTPEGIRSAAGSDAITRQLSATMRRYGDGTPRTRHLTTNLIVEAGEEPDSAICRSYFTVVQVIEGFHLVPVIAGRYHDSFRVEDDVWRFVDRLVMPDLVGDVSHHLYYNS